MLTIEQLQQQLEQLQQQQITIQQQLEQHAKINEGIERIKTIVQEYTITRKALYQLCDDLSLPQIIEEKDSKKRKYTREFRYRNPITAQVWTGAGRRPEWFKLERADEYLIPGMSHTNPVLDYKKSKDPSQQPLTKELAEQLKTLAEGWAKMWRGKRYQEEIKRQYLQELEKQTPHFHYVNNFLPDALVTLMRQWEDDVVVDAF